MNSQHPPQRSARKVHDAYRLFVQQISARDTLQAARRMSSEDNPKVNFWEATRSYVENQSLASHSSTREPRTALDHLARLLCRELCASATGAQMKIVSAEMNWTLCVFLRCSVWLLTLCHHIWLLCVCRPRSQSVFFSGTCRRLHAFTVDMEMHEMRTGRSRIIFLCDIQVECSRTLCGAPWSTGTQVRELVVPRKRAWPLLAEMQRRLPVSGEQPGKYRPSKIYIGFHGLRQVLIPFHFMICFLLCAVFCSSNYIDII